MDKSTLNILINMPGYVVEEVLEITETKLQVLMRPKKKFLPVCSHCGQTHKSGYHSSIIVIAEDQPISGRRVYLHIRKRKHRCPVDGKVHVESTPWLKPYSRVTKRFSEQVCRLTSITTNQEAGWYFGLDDERVYRMDKAHLEAKAKVLLDPIPSAIHLSVDEVSYKKYHKYLTNVIDTDRKVVIWNQKGRKAEILDQYYKGIGNKACGKIESVAMDGARTYISSTTRYAVNALIVYDKFHIVQKINRTVDSVRKLELKKARNENDEELIDLMNSKKRFILLKKKSRLSPYQVSTLDKLYALNEPIFKAKKVFFKSIILRIKARKT